MQSKEENYEHHKKSREYPLFELYFLYWTLHPESHIKGDVLDENDGVSLLRKMVIKIHLKIDWSQPDNLVFNINLL